MSAVPLIEWSATARNYSATLSNAADNFTLDLSQRVFASSVFFRYEGIAARRACGF
jgi:hypothetical protein